MTPKLHVIDTVEGVERLIDYLQDKEFCSYDCETTGLLQTSEVIGFSVCADESEAFYVILSQWNKDTQSLDKLPTHTVAKRCIEALVPKKLIAHNSIFDAMMAECYFKVRIIDSIHTDTLILAHLLNENRRNGLKELAKEYFGADSTKEAEEMKASVLANGGQLTKDNFEMYKADSYLMAKYGAQDAFLTLKLFNTLVPELFDQGLDKFFYEDESMPLLRGPTYELNTTGLRVDVQALQTLKQTLKIECAEAQAFIYQEIDSKIKTKYPSTNAKNRFNIGSSSQMAWLLFGQMGLEFGTLTKEGKNVAKFLIGRLPYAPKAKRDFRSEEHTSELQSH